jgi:hypothetical protein
LDAAKMCPVRKGFGGYPEHQCILKLKEICNSIIVQGLYSMPSIGNTKGMMMFNEVLYL